MRHIKCMKKDNFDHWWSDEDTDTNIIYYINIKEKSASLILFNMQNFFVIQPLFWIYMSCEYLNTRINRGSHGSGIWRIKQEYMDEWEQRKLKQSDEGSQKVELALRKLKLKRARRKLKVRISSLYNREKKWLKLVNWKKGRSGRSNKIGGGRRSNRIGGIRRSSRKGVSRRTRNSVDWIHLWKAQTSAGLIKA